MTSCRLFNTSAAKSTFSLVKRYACSFANNMVRIWQIFFNSGNNWNKKGEKKRARCDEIAFFTSKEKFYNDSKPEMVFYSSYWNRQRDWVLPVESLLAVSGVSWGKGMREQQRKTSSKLSTPRLNLSPFPQETPDAQAKRQQGGAVPYRM